MDLTKFQDRPGWPTYESQLLGRSWVPYWDEADRARLENTGSLVCGRCEGPASYVGMANGSTRLGFVVCLGLGGEALCEDWMWFQAPLRAEAEGGHEE